MNHAAPNLEIRIYTMDGSVTTFVQDEETYMKQILDGFKPNEIFNREKFFLADRNSNTSFPVSKVSRIDLESGQNACLEFPAGIVNALELTRTEFDALIRNPVMVEQWKLPATQGSSIITFLILEMAGGQSVPLTMEMSVEPKSGLCNTTSLLSGSGLSFRMQTGGVAVLNLANLTRLTFYPGELLEVTNPWRAGQYSTKRPTDMSGVDNPTALVMSHSSAVLPSSPRIHLRKHSKQNENPK